MSDQKTWQPTPEMQARSCRLVKELILLALGDN